MRWLILIVFLCGFPVLCMQQEGRAESGGYQGLISGMIDLPEISGAVAIGSHLLVIADDPANKNRPFHMIALLGDAHARLASGRDLVVREEEQMYKKILEGLAGMENGGKAEAKTIADLEGAAVSPEGDIFLISSHSRRKDDKIPKERQRLLRLRLSRDGRVAGQLAAGGGLLPRLPEELFVPAGKVSAREGDDDHVPSGFNIEGLAWKPGKHLLVGLRAPLQGGKAVVLCLHDVNTLFDNPGAPMLLTLEARLDLEGQGIRGMCHDPRNNGYWLLAGNSPDLGASPAKNWSLWFWRGQAADPDGRLMRKWSRKYLVPGQDLNNPEAVTLVGPPRDTQPRSLLLISDNGGGKPSTFTLIPLSALLP